MGDALQRPFSQSQNINTYPATPEGSNSRPTESRSCTSAVVGSLCRLQLPPKNGTSNLLNILSSGPRKLDRVLPIPDRTPKVSPVKVERTGAVAEKRESKRRRFMEAQFLSMHDVLPVKDEINRDNQINLSIQKRLVGHHLASHMPLPLDLSWNSVIPNAAGSTMLQNLQSVAKRRLISKHLDNSRPDDPCAFPDSLHSEAKLIVRQFSQYRHALRHLPPTHTHPLELLSLEVGMSQCSMS